MARRSSKRLKRIRRRLTYLLALKPVFWLLRHGPRPLVTLLLRGLVEPIAWLATRRLSQEHLLKVFGEELDAPERRRIARAVTHSFISSLLEVADALRHGSDWIAERVDGEAAHRFVREIDAAGGPGVIAVTGHIGNWELVGSYMTRVSARGLGAVIAHRMPNPDLNRAIEQVRSDLGMQTLYREDSPAPLLRQLRAGKWVATVPDQDIKDAGGIFIEFLGHQAYTPTGPARLAIAAGAAIAVGGMLRQPDGRFLFHMEELIPSDRSAPRDAEIERLTRAWSAAIERMIRRWPEQWAWFHERWRTTPERLEARGRQRLDAP